MVECGTSFGVSTIYLALAAQKNKWCNKQDHRSVLTIEKDPVKVRKAREIWHQAGSEVEDQISSYEGDLIEILSDERIVPPHIDLLFLDGKLTNPKVGSTHDG